MLLWVFGWNHAKSVKFAKNVNSGVVKSKSHCSRYTFHDHVGVLLVPET
jgi:hypothetical protein